MNEPIEVYYSNRENCIRELGEAREAFGNSKLTGEQREGVDRSLCLMYLYAPMDLQPSILSTLDEHGRRQTMMLTHPFIERRPDCPECKRPHGVALTNNVWRCHMVDHPKPVVCV